MDKVDMTYSFHSTEEPTDDQLSQLMHEACEDAIEKQRNAKKIYFDNLEEDAKAAKAAFYKEYGIA